MMPLLCVNIQIHQLDYATSGVLAIARHREAATIGGFAFSRRETHKEYCAVLLGHVDTESKGQGASQINFVTKQLNSYSERQLPAAPVASARKQHKLKQKTNRKAPVDIHNPSLDRNLALLEALWSKFKEIPDFAENGINNIGIDHSQFQNELVELHGRSRVDFQRGKKVRKQLGRFLRSQCFDADVASAAAQTAVEVETNVDVTNDGDAAGDAAGVVDSEMFLANESCDGDENVDLPTADCNGNNAYPPRSYKVPRTGSSYSDASNPVWDILINIPIADPPPPPSGSGVAGYPFLMHEGRRRDEYICSSSGGGHQLIPVGREAETRLQVLQHGYYRMPLSGETAAGATSDSFILVPVTKVRLQPISGRRHQLRIHCKAIGHPILGDVAYGELYWQQHCDSLDKTGQGTERSIMSPVPAGSWVYGAERMMLHAADLYIPLPDVCCIPSTDEPSSDTGIGKPKARRLCVNVKKTVNGGPYIESTQQISFRRQRQEYADYRCKLLEPPPLYSPSVSKEPLPLAVMNFPPNFCIHVVATDPFVFLKEVQVRAAGTASDVSTVPVVGEEMQILHPILPAHVSNSSSSSSSSNTCRSLPL